MFFAKTDIPHFKGCLVNQLCEATGGPCKYTCRSMKDTHAGMGVTTADFNALVEDLVATLNKFKVGKTEQDELLAILGPMQKDIVEKQYLVVSRCLNNINERVYWNRCNSGSRR